MKLALMQPYFFPYLGYFTLIKQSDKFIVFDTVQFRKGSWINRNRILKECGGTTYINALIHKATLDTSIKNIELKNDAEWKEKILHQMEIYKKVAPYYDEVMKLLKECFSYEVESLSEFNTFTLKKVCDYLEIDYDIEVFSEMNIKIDEVKQPDEWGLNVSKALEAEEYINAPGGIFFYDKEKYIKNGIKINFIDTNLKPYTQIHETFQPYLSILDVMMFNSVEKINEMLDDYRLL